MNSLDTLNLLLLKGAYGTGYPDFLCANSLYLCAIFSIYVRNTDFMCGISNICASYRFSANIRHAYTRLVPPPVYNSISDHITTILQPPHHSLHNPIKKPLPQSRRAAQTKQNYFSPKAKLASTKSLNSGCGRVGRDVNSGWNWDATNHG
jgi:hypothetical protein